MSENYKIISDQPSIFGQSYREIKFNSYKDYSEWKDDPKNSDWIITYESIEYFPSIIVFMEKDI